ncbi:MAG: HAD-superfamily hydrolase, subfamily variant 3 [Bryobacterales bacterium]|nr:HAD-superfamily hydrolase, subfamily variant 3 [Bryobacterales bacterium]
MDGVLVHSMPLHTEAWQRYLRNIGTDIPDLEARMHGKRNAELVLNLIDKNLPDDVAFKHGAAKEKLWREMMLETGIEQYRVRGLQDFLERHRNVPKAIGTNAEPANIEFVLKQFGLAGYFNAAVDGHQVERPKPFPDIYLKCAELLGVHPRNCIVFEDSPTGIEAGRAAGMRLVGVETTATHFKGLDLHIQDFESPELEAWLQAQRVRE